MIVRTRTCFDRSPHFVRWLALAAAWTALAASAAALPQFSLGDPIPLTSTGGPVTHAALADFTGDGVLDVMVSRVDLTGLQLYAGDGLGSFGAPEPTALGIGRAITFDVADVDGDGDQDILALGVDLSSSAHRLHLLLADGAGTYTRTVLAGDAAGYDNLKLIDVTGNGQLDLAFTRPLGAVEELALLFGLGGGFATQPVAVPVDIRLGYELADVSGDGLIDLLVPDPARTTMFAAGLGGGVFGSLAVLQSVGGTEAAWPVRLEDVDGDGDLDVFSLWTNPLSYFQGLGGGTYSDPVSVGGPGNPRETELVDVDGDGDLDVISQQFQGPPPFSPLASEVLVQTSPGVFAPGVLTSPEAPVSALVGDLDGDGRDDLLKAFQGTSFGWHLNTGAAASGYFGPLQEMTAFSINSPYSLFAGDLDGDGDEDVLVSSYDEGTSWLENIASGLTAGPEPLISTNGVPAYSEALDYDGDGDMDIATLTRGFQGTDILLEVWLNDGAMGFTTAFGPVFVSDRALLDIEVGDFDGDGRLDIVSMVASTGIPTSLVLISNAGPATAPAPAAIAGVNAPVQSIRSGELTGDAFDDLVVVKVDTAFSWTVDVLPGGGGGFGSPVSVSGPFLGEAVDVVDLDGDGIDDIVALPQGPGVVACYAGGAGSFSPPLLLVDAPTGFGGDIVQSVDFDGDGDKDLLFPYHDPVTVDGGLMLAKQEAPGVFGDRFIVMGARSEIHAPALFIDLNGDGLGDYVGGAGGAIVASLNTGLSAIGSAFCTEPSPVSRGQLAAVGSEILADNQITLRASGLTPDVLGIAVGSRSIGPPVAVAQGSLCLTGPIGRYMAPGEILDSGPSGIMTLDLDLIALRLPNGSVAALAGETWAFQVWHQQPLPTGMTSRFTTGLRVQIR